MGKRGGRNFLLYIYIIIFHEHRGETEEGVRKTVSVSVIVSGDIRMAKRADAEH